VPLRLLFCLSAVLPIRLFNTVHHTMEMPATTCTVTSPAQRGVLVGPRPQDRVPPAVNVTSLRVCIDVPASPDRPTGYSIPSRPHTLCERLASSAAAQVEAGDDEIFGLSSSSSLFFPQTTDREILTKKIQTTNPHPADAAP